MIYFRNYNYVMMLFTEMKQYAKALHYQQKIDNLLKKLSTPVDGNILASNYRNMAALFMQAGNYGKAVEIQEKAAPQNNSELILTYQSTVELSFNMGEYSKAFNYVELLVYSSRICEIYTDLAAVLYFLYF